MVCGLSMWIAISVICLALVAFGVVAVTIDAE